MVVHLGRRSRDRRPHRDRRTPEYKAGAHRRRQPLRAAAIGASRRTRRSGRGESKCDRDSNASRVVTPPRHGDGGGATCIGDDNWLLAYTQERLNSRNHCVSPTKRTWRTWCSVTTSPEACRLQSSPDGDTVLDGPFVRRRRSRKVAQRAMGARRGHVEGLSVGFDKDRVARSGAPTVPVPSRRACEARKALPNSRRSDDVSGAGFHGSRERPRGDEHAQRIAMVAGEGR